MILQTNMEYPWRERAVRSADGRMVRNAFFKDTDPADQEAWYRKQAAGERFESMCQFARPNRSSPFVCDLAFDVDAPDLEKARQDTLKVFDRLRRLDILPEMVDLFFSGAKGFHVLVPRRVFGSPTEPETLVIWRSLARRFWREGIKHLDLNIYQSSRLLRRVNSLNEKSGLFKIALEYKELRDYGLPYVLDLARAPRDEISMAFPEESPKAKDWFDNDGLPWAKRQKEHRQHTAASTRPVSDFGWFYPYCIRKIETDPTVILPDGCRHEIYQILTRFYVKIGMHPAETERRIYEIDRRHPIRDPDFIPRFVAYSRKSGGSFPHCGADVLKPYCLPDQCLRPRISPHPANDKGV